MLNNVRTSNSCNDNVCTDACSVLYVCVCVFTVANCSNYGQEEGIEER